MKRDTINFTNVIYVSVASTESKEDGVEQHIYICIYEHITDQSVYTFREEIQRSCNRFESI